MGIGEMGVGEMGVGETVVGEMGTPLAEYNIMIHSHITSNIPDKNEMHTLGFGCLMSLG